MSKIGTINLEITIKKFEFSRDNLQNFNWKMLNCFSKLKVKYYWFRRYVSVYFETLKASGNTLTSILWKKKLPSSLGKVCCEEVSKGFYKRK